MDEMAPVRRSLGFLLRDTSRLMRRRFVRCARQAGLPLSGSEASVLVLVDREPGMSQAQLAERLELDAISLVRLIDTLEQSGLIERRRHERDRRIRPLWPTEPARPVVAQAHAVREDVRTQALAGIAEADQERLLDLLMTVRANLATPAASDRNELRSPPDA